MGQNNTVLISTPRLTLRPYFFFFLFYFYSETFVVVRVVERNTTRALHSAPPGSHPAERKGDVATRKGHRSLPRPPFPSFTRFICSCVRFILCSLSHVSVGATATVKAQNVPSCRRILRAAFLQPDTPPRLPHHLPIGTIELLFLQFCYFRKAIKIELYSM